MADVLVEDLAEEFDAVLNCLWHGASNESGRVALARIQARFDQLRKENDGLAEQVRGSRASDLYRRVEELEARLAQAREMSGRLGHVLG